MHEAKTNKTVRKNSLITILLEMLPSPQFFSREHRLCTKIDYFLGQKQISINLKGFKIYKVCSLTTVEFNKK